MSQKLEKEKEMKKKILASIFVVVLLAISVRPVLAQSKLNPCDENCIEKALAGQMSQEELKYLGYGNVVKAATQTYDGDITFVLFQLGMWNRNSAGDVNLIYGTQIPFEAYDFHLQQDGSIKAYMLDESDHLHTWICFPKVPCTTETE